MMFDLSFSESLLILAVALVVLGPERLPKVARTAGVLLGKVRSFVGRVKGEIAQQMQQEELGRLHSSLKESAQTLKKEMDGGIDTLNHTLHAAQNRTPAWERLPEMRTPEDFVHEKTPPPGKSLARQSRSRRRLPARDVRIGPRPRKRLR